MAGNNDFVIIGGDFNAKHTNWKNYNNNFNGIKLFNWYERHKNVMDLKLMDTTDLLDMVTTLVHILTCFWLRIMSK